LNHPAYLEVIFMNPKMTYKSSNIYEQYATEPVVNGTSSARRQFSPNSPAPFEPKPQRVNRAKMNVSAEEMYVTSPGSLRATRESLLDDWRLTTPTKNTGGYGSFTGKEEGFRGILRNI